MHFWCFLLHFCVYVVPNREEGRYFLDYFVGMTGIRMVSSKLGFSIVVIYGHSFDNYILLRSLQFVIIIFILFIAYNLLVEWWALLAFKEYWRSQPLFYPFFNFQMVIRTRLISKVARNHKVIFVFFLLSLQDFIGMSYLCVFARVCRLFVWLSVWTAVCLLASTSIEEPLKLEWFIYHLSRDWSSLETLTGIHRCQQVRMHLILIEFLFYISSIISLKFLQINRLKSYTSNSISVRL